MTEINQMNVFGGVVHEGPEDKDTLPPLKENATELELLDYMVLSLSRLMTCESAFKGGYMLNKILGNHSRLTHDVDLSIAKRGDYEEVKRILVQICERFKEAGYIHSYKVKDIIGERMSGGVDMYSESGQKILGVDIGLHNIAYGIRHYDIGFTNVEAFSVERMLADKLIAITSRKRFRRTKDLYDFYAITTFFDVDMKKLAEYVELRTGAEWENIPFSEAVIREYRKAWEKLNLRSYDATAAIDKPEFADALDRFYKLSIPLKLNIHVERWDSKYARVL